uniref:Uncharacterized protein n=1 Tax=Mustela putorius furo TaxID=9669 RepID=M3Z189_MUSPF
MRDGLERGNSAARGPGELRPPPPPAHLGRGDVDHAGGATLLPQLSLLDLPLAFPGTGARALAFLRGAVPLLLVAPGRRCPRGGDRGGGRGGRLVLRLPGAGGGPGQRRGAHRAVHAPRAGGGRCGRAAREVVVELVGCGCGRGARSPRRGLPGRVTAAPARSGRARGVLLGAHLLALRLPLLQEVCGAAAAAAAGPVATGRHIPSGAGRALTSGRPARLRPPPPPSRGREDARERPPGRGGGRGSPGGRERI